MVCMSRINFKKHQSRPVEFYKKQSCRFFEFNRLPCPMTLCLKKHISYVTKPPKGPWRRVGFRGLASYD